MPLLELAEKKPLSQRFTFLNISGHDAASSAEIGRPPAAVTTSDESIKSLTPWLPEQRDHPRIFFDATDLVPHSVVKTTMLSQKLFINMVTLPSDLREEYKIGDTLFSEIVQDTDKSGNQCYVLTALVSADPRPVTADVRVQGLLNLLRKTLDTDISDQYSLPKMKKKGQLGKIRVPELKAQTPIQKLHEIPNDTASRSLVTEVEPVIREPHNTREASQPSLKHKISPFSRAVLATPLPTMYTHSVAIPLAVSAGSPCSWSVYFDSQDSTLKILLPPNEEFIAISSKSDDFRAFTKDGNLYVLYVGS